MARQRSQNRIPAKKDAYKYPTRFGSHSSMIDEEKTGELNKDKKVVLEDEHGYYVTDEDRIDNGLADPSRYKSSRLKFNKG